MKKLWLAVVLTLSFSSAAFADDAAADIWQAKCKGCHGVDGRAQTKTGEKENIPDFTSTDWQKKESDADIHKVITDGKMITDGSEKKPTKMKPFKDRLSAGEIDSLVQYIRAFGPAKPKPDPKK